MNLHGRPTSDRKSDSIRVRLNDEMRSFVERRAKVEGVSISEIFRRYVDADMHKRQ